MKRMLQTPTLGKRRWYFSTIVAAAAVVAVFRPVFLSSGTSQAGPQKPISVASELVAFPVSVTDSQGNFVSGLGRSNFRVYENNQLREISLFEQENTPLSVGLLVDHSSSMGSKLPNVVTAVSGFTHVSDPQDEMFVVDFGDHARIERFGGKAFTSNRTEIQRAVSVSATGRTALYDAVAAGLDHLQLAHQQKKALVIISDGGDNASEYKYAQVLAKARGSGTAIYAIGLVDEFGEEENPKILKQLCQDTGGIVFFPRSSSEVIEAAATIAEDLRQQYMLGFVPSIKPGESSFRKIRVRVVDSQHGRIHVRTRPGYFVGGETTGSQMEKKAP